MHPDVTNLTNYFLFYRRPSLMATCTSYGLTASLSVSGTLCPLTLAVIRPSKGMKRILNLLIDFVQCLLYVDTELKRQRTNQRSVLTAKAMPNWPRFLATIHDSTVSRSASNRWTRTHFCFWPSMTLS